MPRSKRQRKQKDKLSLKSKKGGGDSWLESAGAEELDSNAIILPANKATREPAAHDGGAAPVKQLSKSQQRKLRKITEEKARRAQRADTMSTLAQHQMGAAQMSLLRPVSARGQKVTKKQALRRALQLQRAGVDLPSDVRLFQERRAVDTEGGSGGDADSSTCSEASEDEGNRHASLKGPAGKRKATANNSASDSGEEGREAQHQAPLKRQKAAADAAPAGSAPALQPPVAAAAADPAAVRRQLREAAELARRELGSAEQLAGEADDLGQSPQPAVPLVAGPARVVLVDRSPEIDAMRCNLPIIGMEQEIMEAVAGDDVVVLCGETGCGKTTQVPQFLYEAGYGCAAFPEKAGAVGVTQPRRVAAVSTATRVADELVSRLGQVVGYQVRYDKRVGEGTALKFMTDGILLREVQEDFLLRKYSAVVVDEAHERSLNTDILLGMLSRIVALRRSMAADPSTGVYPLKLIIMSATLRTEDFVANRRLFPRPPPVVSVPARQYPVTVHFSRRTEMHDYAGAAYKKTCQIHRTLPPGGVLVFATGQREVEFLCRKLRRTFAAKAAPAGGPGGSAAAPPLEQEEEEELAGGWSGGDAAEADAADAALEGSLLLEDRAAGADDCEDESSGDEEEVVVLGGERFTVEQIAEAERAYNERLAGAAAGGAPNGEGDREVAPVHVLPLYAMLPPAQQARVFRPPPPGHRLIVVATNVAETSLTIPGIRYVVDCGRSKQRLLESAAGLARFEVRWVSKASAEQRAGRAGRTGPGHCYRLFSSAHFNDTFPRHSPPEIVNTALEGVALVLKSLGVDRVANFPFPSPPEAGALAAAERCLVALSALDPATGKLTATGRAMAQYPITPRHARMVLAAAQYLPAGSDPAAASAAGGKRTKSSRQAAASGAQLVAYAVALAAALSVESPFVSVDSLGAADVDDAEAGSEGAAGAEAAERSKLAAAQRRGAARAAHAQFRVGHSDALSALCVLCAFEAAGEEEAFCRTNHLHFKNLREAAALRKQLARMLQVQQAQEQGAALPWGRHALAPAPPSPPPPAAMEALRRALAAGWADQVARRVRSLEHVHSQGGGEGRKGRAVRYRSCALEEDVFLHPNSALHASAPEFVVYSELIRTAKRPYMAGVTAVEPRWLPAVAAPMCTFSPPLPDPPPFYNAAADSVMAWRDVTFGAQGWPLPRQAGPHPDAAERCAVFAAALLEGRVLAAMQALRPALAVPPSMALRPESRMHKRVADLLHALQGAGVDSKAALAQRWRRDPAFLRPEVGQWLPAGAGAALGTVLAAVLKEAEAGS